METLESKMVQHAVDAMMGGGLPRYELAIEELAQALAPAAFLRVIDVLDTLAPGFKHGEFMHDVHERAMHGFVIA